ncbi:uncharacterized protein LOC123320929 isoform X1 [Coccinella septempunctata]|uniref:uncharacterized protein LOC123320929 isoform X1 n=1 Tax=Coccinella septempunctata TaxID=41139 RepID=UPI001D087101|nr:uncharacterized protein LOC123320929 isoform X1 [Coccinella septempunctata]
MLTKGFLLLLYFIPFLRRLFECSNKKIVIPFVNNLDEFYWYRGAFGFGHCGRSLLATSTNTGYTGKLLQRTGKKLFLDVPMDRDPGSTRKLLIFIFETPCIVFVLSQE